MNAVLAAAGLGKKYGRTWALSDCTLEVPAGRVVGLVGPNGAGKSTFLNLAAHGPLRASLEQWLAKARRAGLDDESIEALFLASFRSAVTEETA